MIESTGIGLLDSWSEYLTQLKREIRLKVGLKNKRYRVGLDLSNIESVLKTGTLLN